MAKDRKDTLVIEDTGIGISPEDLPRVVEKGFTGYNGRDHKKSTGLGLYLSKEILAKLNHKLTLESEVESGRRFSFIWEELKPQIGKNGQSKC